MIKTRILDLPVQSAVHAHAHHQLIVGLEGSADFEVEGISGAVNRLQACLVPGHRWHAFSGRGPNHMLILDLYSDQPDLGSGEADGLGRLFDVPRFVRLDQRMQGLLDFAVQVLGSDDAAASPMAWHLGGLLLHGLHDRLFSTPVPLSSAAAIDLEKLEAYVRGNLERAISVPELATFACVSSSHFHQLFKQVSGLTPHQFVLKIRLEQAIHMLTRDTLAVAEVASRCGFSSQSALTHAVRRATGKTPKRLRMLA
ncbi:MAG: AraC family transcriptional regulator [Pseudomonadaceae bacterium]|nr:MAG: AraC family transcriptional regulator [Pseudomonadaceae bacterium]